jgi:hypothetical protein
VLRWLVILGDGGQVGWNRDARSAEMGSKDLASSAELNIPQNHRLL